MVERVVGLESIQEFYDQETNKVVGILKKANPVRIIRFGSVARGEPRPESDLDLCVLIEWQDDRPAFRIVQSFYRLLSKHKYSYPIDVEFKAYRPAEFDELLRRGNYFVEEIAAGEVVYERD
ncbi:MAG: nucleotidyltransferase domain-containing protein [Anaerolineae bacterium]